MDTRMPHGIWPEDEIPEEAKKHAVPIAPDVAEALKDATPEQRAAYLRTLRSRMIDVPRTAAIAQTVFDKLQAVVDPLIDKMDDKATDKKNAPQLIGMMIGVRAWVSQFEAVEEATAPALLSLGISRAAYDSMRIKSQALGIQCVELIKTLVED